MDGSTIAAIATPFGSAGIGIIRISGSKALSIAAAIFCKTGQAAGLANGADPQPHEALKSHQLYHGHIVDPDNGRVLDEVLVSAMYAPHSYTRENVVEINSHSGTIVLKNILDLVLKKGAQLAEPGEFTKRAFINGRIDLTQAEAVIDVINARTGKALEIATAHMKGDFKDRIESIRDVLLRLLTEIEAAIDFPEDVGEILVPETAADTLREGAMAPLKTLVDQYLNAHILRDGMVLAVVGRPNVGKSSLMNRLIRKERVIVSPIPGTTRDFIEETVNIHGIPTVIADTAGLHATKDPIEVIGIKKTEEYINNADLILFMVDAGSPLLEEDYNIFKTVRKKNVILVLNKSDLVEEGFFLEKPHAWDIFPSVTISVLYDRGLDKLKDQIATSSMGDFDLEERNTIIPNLRHKLAIDRSLEAIAAAVEGIQMHTPFELVTIDIKAALASLGEILGITVKEDILDQIFSRFCIGK